MKTTNPDAQAQKLIELLPRMLQGLLKRENNFLTQGRISLPQMLALEFLRSQGDSRMSDLAAALSIQMASATGLVNRLLRVGYVSRKSDQLDRRVVKVGLTKKGRDVVDTILSQKKQTMTDVFSRLSESDRKQYLRVLEKICHILQEMPVKE